MRIIAYFFLSALTLAAASCTGNADTASQRDLERKADYASISARVILAAQLAETNRCFLILNSEIPELRVLDFLPSGGGSQSLSSLEASSDMTYQFRFNRPITEAEHKRLAGRLPYPQTLSAGLLHLTDSAGRWQESMEILPYSSRENTVLAVRLRARMDTVR